MVDAKMNESSPPELSLVIPMHNESAMVAELFRRLRPVLERSGKSFEIICVNDGSTDDTLDKLVDEQSEDPNLFIVDLSRSFGKEAALTAGIEQAQGNAVIVMDADLQDPPELIEQFVAKWEEGFEVVYGVRRSREQDSWLKHKSAKLFYAVFNKLSQTKLPMGAGDFRLLDRVAVEALLQLPEHSRFMKGIFSWIGFNQIGVPFDRPERFAGNSKWPYIKLFRFAMDGLFAFSTVPLRLWTWIGLVTALLGFSYSMFLIIRVMIYGRDVPGYASIMVTVLVLGGIQLISVGILGEYLGRIFREVKARPLYIIKRKLPPAKPQNKAAQKTPLTNSEA